MSDPSTLSGKVLWLRAKDLGAGGSSVTSWADQSGASHDASSPHARPTVAAASTPSGGKSLRCDYAHLYLPSLGLTGDGEMWIVVKSDNLSDSNADSWKFGTQLGGSVNSYYGYAGVVYDDFGSDTRRSFTPTASLGAWRLYRVAINSTRWFVEIDNVQQAEALGATRAWNGTPSLSGSRIADGSLNAGGGGFKGNIAEVLVRSAVSTSTEVADLITYFNTEHGLTVPGGSSGASGSAALTSSSTLTAGGVVSKVAAAALAATSVLTAGAVADRAAAAGLSATSTLSASAGAFSTGTAELTATSTLAAAGDTVTPIDGAAALSATSTLTAAGATALPAAAALAASSTLSADGSLNGLLTATAALLATSTLTATAGVATVMTGWTADLTGQAILELETGDGIAWLAATPAAAPDGLVERPVIRSSNIWDAPTPNARNGAPFFVNPPAAVRELLGVAHVWLGGVDVTYLRGKRTQIGEYGEASPWGDDSATVTFPQVHAWEDFGTGDLYMFKPGARLEIGIDQGPGHPVLWQFAGKVFSKDNRLVIGGGGSSTTITAEGSLLQTKRQYHRMPIIMPPTDIGRLVADELNGTANRGFALIPRVVTGIKSRDRGSSSDKRADYISQLLALAWREDGSQLTIAKTLIPRRHRLAWKPTTASTPRWTITAGARGVTHDLTEWDLDDAKNVIYGYGIGPDGRRWAGWCFPNLNLYEMPPYPYASAGTVMTLGSTDAGTLTGKGVSLWQSRMVEQGLRVRVDGVFGSQDRSQTFVLQRRAGILQDGIVGPQTWAATFDGGISGADLSQAYRRPLAWDPRVEEFLYAANGARLGRNPVWERARDRSEDDVDFGTKITRDEARPHAQLILARNLTPAITGTITLDKWASPHEGASFEMHANDLLEYRGYGNADPRLVVSGLRKDPQSGRVQLAVDTRARDAMTWAAMRKRDQDAQPDPARTRGRTKGRKGLDMDVVVPFDGDGPAGKIGAKGGVGMPLYAGLWTCRWVYVGEAGQTAWIKGETYSPAAKCAMLLFSGNMTSNQLAAKFPGGPLSQAKPWSGLDDWLDDHGFIVGWGVQGQALGYGTGSEADGDPLTGKIDERSPVTYEAFEHGGWIKACLWAPVSTFVRLEFRPAVVQ